MAIFNSSVKLPEGNNNWLHTGYLELNNDSFYYDFSMINNGFLLSSIVTIDGDMMGLPFLLN